MAEADEETGVAERLGRLLDRGLLPAGGPAEAAERLIERLQRPARIALLGLPGSGKSAILNLLAGTVVVPETLRLPSIIVQHGDAARMVCTLSDGQTVTLPGDDLEKVLPLSPALVTLELNLPALKVIGLLEVAAGSMESEQRRAALWAGKRADIIIWCSTAYLPKEQLIWEGMPDAYKDNGFLLLTKIDLLGGREAASGMYQRVAQRAAGEFRQVIPISAREAREAATAGKTVDRERFRESGAATLISTIKSRVHLARQADIDTAELLLARHSEIVDPTPRPKFELRAISGVGSPVSSEDSLADEAAALQRVAAAAAEAKASPAVTASVPSEIPADLPQPVEPSPPPRTLDPFPEPKIEFDEPEVDLSVILEKETEPALSAVTMSDGETEDPATDAAEIEGPAPNGTGEPETVDMGSSAPEVQAERPQEPDLARDDPEVPAADETGDLQGAPENSDTIPSFAARLRELSPENQADRPGLVPLRATWKSRHDQANAMPIVPKPEPNRNPPPRQLPESVANEARLVGRGQRLGEPAGAAGSEGTETTTPLSDVAALDQDVSVAAQTGAATGKTSNASTDQDRRTPRITSVFASRPRRDSGKEPSTEDHPTIGPTPTNVPVEPMGIPESELSVSDDAALKALEPVPEEGERGASSSPGLPAMSKPGEDLARDSLSVRLKSERRPISVLKVLRAEAPFSSPQEDVSPRTIDPLDRRLDVVSTERRERPRILPREPSQNGLAEGFPASERALVEAGIALIVSRSVDLSDQIDPDERPDTDLILSHAGETVDQVLDILSRGASPLVRGLGASLGEIQDLIMLMQLEKGRAPADDALTLLLQLRREMETLCAG